jgi:hypothetical protein
VGAGEAGVITRKDVGMRKARHNTPSSRKVGRKEPKKPRGDKRGSREIWGQEWRGNLDQ